MNATLTLKEQTTKYFHKKGYKIQTTTTLEGSSGTQHEFALIVTKPDGQHPVQILNWRRTVGVNQIINLDKASEDVKLKKPILVSEKFSSHAKSYANRKGITLLTTRELTKF